MKLWKKESRSGSETSVFWPGRRTLQEKTSLMKPIQDEVYNAIQTISNDKGYQLILDKSSSMNIIFSSPKIDISDEVLVKLGYSNINPYFCENFIIKTSTYA